MWRVAAAVALVLALTACEAREERPAATTVSPAATTLSLEQAAVLMRPSTGTRICGRLHYEGPGVPDVVFVSDFVLNGPTSARGRQQVRAVRLVLEQHGWKAGETRVGYYSCRRYWDAHVLPDTCRSNATAYAHADAVVAVITASSTSCTLDQLPILNRAPGGGVVVVGTTETYPCLTRAARAVDCLRNEPARYFASGKRTFARVRAHWLFDAAALALLAREQRIRRVYLLRSGYFYGLGRPFANAARRLGIRIVGSAIWRHDAGRYVGLMRRVAKTRPDGILVINDFADTEERLLEDKVAVLGPNTGPVRLLATSDSSPEETLRTTGPSAKGVLVVIVGLDPEHLPPRGRAFVASLRERFGAERVFEETPYAAQAAEVILQAIAESDGTRSGVRDALYGLRVRDGIVGDFKIDERGDPTYAPVSVYRVDGGIRFMDVVEPPEWVVDAAAGE